MRSVRRICLFVVILGCVWGLFADTGIEAQPAEIALPAPGREGWEPLTFRKIPQHTRYTPVSIDEREAVRAESRCSASALVHRLAKTDLEQTPLLQWEWKVERGFEIRDHRVKAGDDFVARVYVLFEFEPRGASTWERLRRRAASAVFGVELPGNAINYVWTSREPAGATWENPYTERSKMISRGDGPLGVWRREQVDVLADHRALLGDPPRVVAVALMSDSDGSCQEATAYFANFRFTSHSRRP